MGMIGRNDASCRFVFIVENTITFVVSLTGHVFYPVGYRGWCTFNKIFLSLFSIERKWNTAIWYVSLLCIRKSGYTLARWLFLWENLCERKFNRTRDVTIIFLGSTTLPSPSLRNHFVISDGQYFSRFPVSVTAPCIRVTTDQPCLFHTRTKFWQSGKDG